MSWRDNYKTVRPVDERHDSDTIKILIATDIHLGFEEEDLIRGDDSFDAFEEVLMLASQEQVDLILLGGDLFHENKPSRSALHKCMSLIKQYCFGSRDVKIFRSIFPNDSRELMNYEDPNLNISIPIFTIHGNHDDPTGPGNLSVINLLSVAGLVNYFGKSDQIDKIEVDPLVVEKGITKLALYGLGAVRNERLYRTFSQNNVTFLRTHEEAFNLLILHQNRVKHGEKSYVKPEFIPTFMDLVFWGHEHDNNIVPFTFPVGNGYISITQPGSTVATSLSEGESGDKNVGLLYIKGNKYTIEPRVLTSIRPFPSPCEIFLEDRVDAFDDKGISEYISAKMDNLLEDVKTKFPDNPKLPLLRIKVHVPLHSYNANNIKRTFCAKYSKLVANPGEVVLFSKKAKRRGKSKDGLDESIMIDPEDPYVTAEESIIDLFQASVLDQELNLFHNNLLSLNLEQFVVKEEAKAIEHYSTQTLKKSLQIFKNQIESRPGLSSESMDLVKVKQELESIAYNPEVTDLSLSLNDSSDDDNYSRINDQTDDLIASQMSPNSSVRSPPTSPSGRPGPKVQLRTRGGMRRGAGIGYASSLSKPQKRSRSSRTDLTDSSDPGTTSRARGGATSKRGPKKRRI